MKHVKIGHIRFSKALSELPKFAKIITMDEHRLFLVDFASGLQAQWFRMPMLEKGANFS